MGIFNKLTNLIHKKEDKDSKLSTLDVSYPVPNYIRAKSTIYLQDILSKITGNSIKLKLVNPNKANYPKEWIIPGVINDCTIKGKLALVDIHNDLYGVLFEHDIEQCGRIEGEWVDCLVTRTSQNHIELHVPYSTQRLIEQNEIEKANLSIIIGDKQLQIEINENITHFENCTLILEENTGKKKPLLVLKTSEDKVIFKMNAQSKYYKELEPWVGKTSKTVNIYRNESKYSENEYYYAVKLNFYDK